MSKIQNESFENWSTRPDQPITDGFRIMSMCGYPWGIRLSQHQERSMVTTKIQNKIFSTKLPICRPGPPTRLRAFIGIGGSKKIVDNRCLVTRTTPGQGSRRTGPGFSQQYGNPMVRPKFQNGNPPQLVSACQLHQPVLLCGGQPVYNHLECARQGRFYWK